MKRKSWKSQKSHNRVRKMFILKNRHSAWRCGRYCYFTPENRNCENVSRDLRYLPPTEGQHEELTSSIWTRSRSLTEVYFLHGVVCKAYHALSTSLCQTLANASKFWRTNNVFLTPSLPVLRKGEVWQFVKGDHRDSWITTNWKVKEHTHTNKITDRTNKRTKQTKKEGFYCLCGE